MYYGPDVRITPQLNENAIRVLEKRYLRGETPDEFFLRVAKCIAQAERNYPITEVQEFENVEQLVDGMTNIFFNMMASLDFLPNSPTLMNAGRPLGQLAACFVVPVGDSMEGIFQAIKDMAMIQKTGGGTGFSFSRLRPKDDPVSSTSGESSGPISFMKAFNACTEVVKQGGARRGANMGILRVDHPDILDFIDCKKNLTELTNFNISVGITNEFMECLKTGNKFTLRFNGTEYVKVEPKLIWDKIIEGAWKSGEPGIVFLDILNEDNPTPEVGEIESTNPCGEQPLLPFEACNLGSINLSNFGVLDYLNEIEELFMQGYTHDWRNNWQPLLAKCINWEKLKEVSWGATRFLDNVIDVNNYPLPEIEKMAKSNRKIGLGIMGWADLLFQLRIPYDSHPGLLLAEMIMSFIQTESHACSMMLAHSRGVFPNYEKSVWNDTGLLMRNATTTTIAPTGTLSVVAGTSSGIEPNFGLSYTKTLTDGGKLKVTNKYLLYYMESNADIDSDMRKSIIEDVISTGSLKKWKDVPTMKYAVEVFKSAHEITPRWHIWMQSAFQKFTDNAVSKTINFRNETTREEISEAFIESYVQRCKGVTSYRDGSRDTQPLTTSDKPADTSKSAQNTGTTINDILSVCASCKARKQPTKLTRPQKMPGYTEHVATGCGSMFVTVNEHEGNIYEVFLKAGSTGGCAAFTEGTSRLISLGLRYGVPVEEIIDQLNSVRCDNFRHQTGKNPSLKGKSCPDVVGKMLKQHLKEMTSKPAMTIVAGRTGEIVKIVKEEIVDNKCPDCGEEIENAEGCIVCRSCGFSKC